LKPNRCGIGNWSQADVRWLAIAALVVAGCQSGANAPQATPVPTVPTVLPSGVILSEFGDGEMNTATFNAPATYAVSYSYDCTGRQVAQIKIEAVGKGQSYETILNGGTFGKMAGTTYGHGAGPIYLDVAIGCPWSLSVRTTP
jgi:hypothetical protein